MKGKLNFPKRLFATVLSAVMAFTTVPAIGAETAYAFNTLPDVSETHWARNSIEKMVNQNILSGDESGNLHPDRPVTRAEYVAMINAMQRLRDILYSNIPKKDKKKLMTLVTALITKKYGSWHDNDIYNSSKKKLPYRLRMKLIEYFIEPYDASMETEESLKQKIKNKSETIKKNAD